MIAQPAKSPLARLNDLTFQHQISAMAHVVEQGGEAFAAGEPLAYGSISLDRGEQLLPPAASTVSASGSFSLV